MLTELISKVPSVASGIVILSAPSVKEILYFLHSARTRSKLANLIMTGSLKPLRNILMKRIDLKSEIGPIAF